MHKRANTRPTDGSPNLPCRKSFIYTRAMRIELQTAPPERGIVRAYRSDIAH